MQILANRSQRRRKKNFQRREANGKINKIEKNTIKPPFCFISIIGENPGEPRPPAPLCRRP